jgi:hypothetical protein
MTPRPPPSWPKLSSPSSRPPLKPPPLAPSAEKNLKSVEARRAALAGVDSKVATAKSNVAKAQVAREVLQT